jgi:hypothetical protein
MLAGLMQILDYLATVQADLRIRVAIVMILAGFFAMHYGTWRHVRRRLTLIEQSIPNGSSAVIKDESCEFAIVEAMSITIGYFAVTVSMFLLLIYCPPDAHRFFGVGLYFVGFGVALCFEEGIGRLLARIGGRPGSSSD